MTAHIVTYSGTRTQVLDDAGNTCLMHWTHAHAYRTRGAAKNAAKQSNRNGFTDVTIGKARTAAFESNGYQIRRTEYPA